MEGKSKYVVVKRRWQTPEILAYITDQEVGARMDINDFARRAVELMYEDKERYYLLSKDAATGLLLKAVARAMDEMKAATVHVA